MVDHASGTIKGDLEHCERRGLISFVQNTHNPGYDEETESDNSHALTPGQSQSNNGRAKLPSRSIEGI